MEHPSTVEPDPLLPERQPDQEVNCPHPDFLRKHWSSSTKINKTEAAKMLAAKAVGGSPVQANTVRH
jgi:hypothetical protein